MIICFKPSFVREFKKLPPAFREEAMERIEMFKNTDHHQKLKVYKLK